MRGRATWIRRFHGIECRRWDSNPHGLAPTAATQTRNSQTARCDDAKGINRRTVGSLFQGWAREGGNRLGKGQKGARQARGFEAPRGGAGDGTRCEGEADVNVLLLLATLLPQQILIATSRGQTSIPVSNERGAGAVAALLLAQPLGLAASLNGSSVSVTLGDRAFDFELDSPFVRYGGIAYPLVSAPYVARDTIFLPLHWLTDYVPRLMLGRYRWDPWLARLDEVTVAAADVVPTPSSAPPPPPPPPPLPPAAPVRP